jgi:multimeric flavodoxin WrbA
MVAVVFQSAKGHTKVLADAVQCGINEVNGVGGQSFQMQGKDIREGRFLNPELMAVLDQSDGVVFGCATYMGSASAVFKSFLETAFQPHWLEQRWKDKIAAGFTNSASQNGDKLSTLLQLTIFAMQTGMIWVGVGELPGNTWSGGARTDLNRLGTWLGAVGQSNADEDSPSIGDIDTAKRLSNRVALIARRLKDGAPFETERQIEAEFRKNNVARRETLAKRIQDSVPLAESARSLSLSSRGTDARIEAKVKP